MKSLTVQIFENHSTLNIRNHKVFVNNIHYIHVLMTVFIFFFAEVARPESLRPESQSCGRFGNIGAIGSWLCRMSAALTLELWAYSSIETDGFWRAGRCWRAKMVAASRSALWALLGHWHNWILARRRWLAGLNVSGRKAGAVGRFKTLEPADPPVPAELGWPEFMKP